MRLILLLVLALSLPSFADPLTDSIMGVGEGFSESLLTKMNKRNETRVISYGGYDVEFSYFSWHIRHNTVCARYSQQLTKFAECTQAARELFTEACYKTDFSGVSDSHTRSRIKGMFCEAARTYQPVVANMIWSDSKSEVDEAKRKCNLATAMAAGSEDPDLINARDESCL